MRPVALVTIWTILLALLGVSIALGYWGSAVLATTLIFTVAVFKAVIVAAYYMRIKWEPKYILGILLGAVGLVLILYFTLMPDIVYQYGG